jgi:hypothetical protein
MWWWNVTFFLTIDNRRVPFGNNGLKVLKLKKSGIALHWPMPTESGHYWNKNPLRSHLGSSYFSNALLLGRVALHAKHRHKIGHLIQQNFSSTSWLRLWAFCFPKCLPRFKFSLCSHDTWGISWVFIGYHQKRNKIMLGRFMPLEHGIRRISTSWLHLRDPYFGHAPFLRHIPLHIISAS